MTRITEISQRIRQWQGKENAHPYKLDVFLTNRCNLNCRFCQFPLLSKQDYEDELTSRQIYDIIEEAAKLDVKIVGLLGGEPFIRSDIIDIMALIKKKGMDGSLVTNGTLCAHKDIKKIIEMEWNLIRISIDGSTEDIHDSLRGATSLKKIIKTITHFEKIKKELHENNPTLEINTVLCTKNMKDLAHIVECASLLNIKRIHFLPMIEFSQAIDDLKIKEKDIKILQQNIALALCKSEKYHIITNLESIKKDTLFLKSNKMDTIIFQHQEQKNFVPCYLPWYGINISADGNVTPCAAASGNPELVCGNVKKSSLKDIWKNRHFVRLRKSMINKKLPSVCSRCCVPLLYENNQIRTVLGLS